MSIILELVLDWFRYVALILAIGLVLFGILAAIGATIGYLAGLV